MSHYTLSAIAGKYLEGIVDYTLERWGSRQVDIYITKLEKGFVMYMSRIRP